jgi:heme/copper-type cytochrome/quinol oxidase subunit 1
MNAVSPSLGAPTFRLPPATMLSVLWIALCVAFFAAGAVGGAFLSGAPDTSLHDTYYVVAHSGWVVSIGVLLVAFAAFHLITARWLASRYRWSLGWGHLALTALGVALLSAPQIGLALAPPTSYVDYDRAFSVWQVVSSAGYVTLLLGALLFAALCVALFIPHKKGPAA